MKRVVVTGLGMVSPVGLDVNESWENIKNEKHGFSEITRFDMSGLKVRINAEVKNFEYPDKREGRRMDLYTKFGVVAADEAIKSSGLVVGKNIKADKFGAYVGTGIGGVETLEDEIRKSENTGLRSVSPLLSPKIIGNILPGQIAIRNKIHGSCIDIVSACACGTNSIGEAYRAIKDGYLTACFAGGAEAPFAKVTFAGFDNMTAMSRSTDPNRASIPFDKERDGFVMGEGAGIIILEELENALKRNANILCEMVGYGSTTDAYHITLPNPDALMPAEAMRQALEDANVKPEEVSYINAHGTATPANDLTETLAIKKVFGENTKVPISSTKSMTGHLLGAAGGIEAVFSVKSIMENIMPMTLGYKVKDPELNLDYITEGTRQKEVNIVMSNSLGFGGHNASIVFRKFFS